MTRQTVGGRYWADATPQDRQQLVDEYRIFLAHTFANAIAQYTNQTVFFAPLHMQQDDREVTVRTAVIDPADEPTELDYRMEKTASGWMVYDVDVDYIWLTRIYRSNFGNELRQGGVHNLVRALHKKNQEVAVARNNQGVN
jgi:phospholipid transport system substrate-binding protein